MLTNQRHVLVLNIKDYNMTYFMLLCHIPCIPCNLFALLSVGPYIYETHVRSWDIFLNFVTKRY